MPFFKKTSPQCIALQGNGALQVRCTDYSTTAARPPDQKTEQIMTKIKNNGLKLDYMYICNFKKY